MSRRDRNSRRMPGLIAACVLAGLALLAYASVLAAAPGGSGAARACGAEGNQVAAEISLSRASDVWDHLPGMLRAPELEVDTRPAQLVVFAGSVDTRGIEMATADKPATLQLAICVVQADGTVNLYSDVSRAGSRWAP